MLASKKNLQIKRILLDAFKLIVLLEFIINLYSFSYITEMILLPILVFIVLLISFAERNPEHQIVANFLNLVLAIWGIYVLYFSIQQIQIHINEISTIQTALDFLLPIWLTVFYLPFLLGIKLYSDWELQNLRKR
jgi:hypothetical protein